MRTLPIFLLLICGLLSACCSTINPERVKALKKEIADIGSSAQIPGPRDTTEKNRINKDVLKMWEHLDEITGVDSSQTTPDLTKKP
jgi:hypothetical protein